MYSISSWLFVVGSKGRQVCGHWLDSHGTPDTLETLNNLFAYVIDLSLMWLCDYEWSTLSAHIDQI